LVLEGAIAAILRGSYIYILQYTFRDLFTTAILVSRTFLRCLILFFCVFIAAYLTFNMNNFNGIFRYSFLTLKPILFIRKALNNCDYLLI